MTGGVQLQIFIDQRSSQPIYDQIFSQIKGQILSGALQPEDALPSIRGLSRDLQISVITTKRAYEELEREGYIYTVAARGSFVARKDLETVRANHKKEIEAHFREARRLAAECGMSEAELAELFRQEGER